MPSPLTPTPFVKLKHPAWSKNASIYEINLRQFTPEGTLRAAEKHLPRLKKLGVDILWLMPVHEIGVKNRKGTLGSPYAVKDYYSVNHEFGTLADFKHFVRAAHKRGFHVIIDWVINHTAWDCNLATEHPDWYSRNWKGEFQPTPWRDWTDVIDLDWTKPALRKYMTDAMKFWVRDCGVDGFRCDVAGFIPVDFWNNARKALARIKPVFMLAEWESRDLHAEAFDMTYGWNWFDVLRNIMEGKCGLDELIRHYSHVEGAFPEGAISMLFVTNHDKNSWEGTEFEVFGPALKSVIVLSVVTEGMPLIHNGQEAGNARRLEFFEKDPITWKSHPNGELYRKLLALKKKNPALWNGNWGGSTLQVINSSPDHVFSFMRLKSRNKIFGVFNLSGKTHSVTFPEGPHEGMYTDFFTGKKAIFPSTLPLRLNAWDCKVFVSKG
jgi:glycosidase